MRSLFLNALFLLFSLKLLAWDLDCPYGCGNPEVDPNTARIGKEFLWCTRELGFNNKKAKYPESGSIYDIDWDADIDWCQDEEEEWKMYTFCRLIWRKDWSGRFEREQRNLIISQDFTLTHYPEFTVAYSALYDDLIVNQESIIEYTQKTLKEYRERLSKFQKGLKSTQELLALPDLTEDEHKEAFRSLEYYQNQVLDYPKYIASHENKLLSCDEERSKKLQILDKYAKSITYEYRRISNLCAKYHHWQGAFYESGLINFHEGQIEEALDDMLKVIDAAKQNGMESLLPAEAYLSKGLVESEVGQYNDAILSLSHAIEKDPMNKEAYFERAVAYFEIGEFDQSLNDYLEKGKELNFPLDEYYDFSDFAVGILVGAKKGVAEASTEFLPSLLSSVRGLGNLLWATIEHPIEAPKQFAAATSEFCTYLKTCDKAELAQILAPEMYELIENWDNLDQKRRGELSGYCLGRYGTDFLLPVAAAKGVQYVKAYRNIKTAEKLCTLETLAKSPESKEALTQAATKWNKRRDSYFAKVKFLPDQQNKHIPGKHNFEQGGGIWTHPEPQKLFHKHAGKGQKVRGIPGEPDYRERVDFGEIIGYYVTDKSTEQLPTTMGIIHYSKKGGHIVPAAPKK